jgi:hypothetical protein
MPEQQIQWTALPRAADAKHLELAVFVSPRLGIDAAQSQYALSDFPDFVEWTTRVASDLTFSVEFDDGSVHTATRLSTEQLDDALWTHLFPPETVVEPWSFQDQGQRNIRSYPVRWTTAYLRKTYQEVVRASPTALPDPGALDGLRGELGGLIDTRVGDEGNTGRLEPGGGGGPGPGPSGCLTALLTALCKLFDALCGWLSSELARLISPSAGTFVEKLCKTVRKWVGGLVGDAAGATVTPIRGPRWVPQRPAPAGPSSALATINAQIAANGVVPPTPPSAPTIPAALASRDPAVDFAQALRFYQRPENQSPPLPEPDITQVPAPPSVPDMDFHRKLGALGDYPVLLLRLGIVITLRIDRPARDPESIRIVPAWDGAARPAIDITPRTNCALTDDSFLAAPAPWSDLRDGGFDLTGAGDRLEQVAPVFDVVQVEGDGSVIKAILTAASLERRRQLVALNRRGIAAPKREGLPALQTAGLAIVRTDRAFDLWTRLQRIAQLVTPTPPAGGAALNADDLVRGFQVLIEAIESPARRHWRSLCSRHGTYRLVDDAGKVVRTLHIDDDGYVKRSTATSADDATSDLYVHEAMTRWLGWSLVVPRTGRTIVPVPGTRTLPDGTVAPTQGETPGAPASTAPAGFRLETRFAVPNGTLPRLRFGWRYRVRMPWVDMSGQRAGQKDDALPTSDEVVYLRFEAVGPPALLSTRPYTPGSSIERLVIRSDRTKTAAQWLAGLSGPHADFLAADVRIVFPPKTSQQMAELHGKLDDAFGTGATTAKRNAAFAIAKREQGTFGHPAIQPFGTVQVVDGGQPGEYVINRDDHGILMTPYLPDPLAAGVALRDVPGLIDNVTGDPLTVTPLPSGDPVLQVPFDLAPGWPDARSFRLRVSDEQPGKPPNWDASTRVLTVYLDKAVGADITYGSYLAPADLDLMGMWDWVDDGTATLRAQTQLGANWAIMPWRTVALVHAVQHPLKDPSLSAGQAVKTAIGQTAAQITGTIHLDVPSTGRIDLLASWTEQVDDVTKPGPVAVAHTAAVGNWNIEVTSTDPQPLAGDAHHEFGDTHHRSIDYSLQATTRFREYMPASLQSDISSLGPATTLEVASSARPDAPTVLYAVPAFGWRGDPLDKPLAASGTLNRTRVGGTLRIYVDRPWYSSGDGELLGILLPGSVPLPPTLVSRVGIDPTRVEQPVTTVTLDPAMFPGAVVETDLSLPEAGLNATVAAFTPAYDAARRLWYCHVALDMSQLPWGAWPFIRLALVRYQPSALPDAKLSKVVLAEFAQLAPDRQLTVVRPDAKTVEVTVRGRAQVGPRPPRLLFELETAQTASPDELDWHPLGAFSQPPSPQDYFNIAVPPTPDAGEFAWSTTMTLPAPAPTPLRLAIRELELEPSDGEFERGIVRIVYADRVGLT